MSTTSNIPVTPGSGDNVATYSISEDTITKQIGRNVISSSSGTELATTSNPVNVALPSATVTTLTPPTNTGYALDSSLSTIDTDLKSNITLHAGTNNIGNVGSIAAIGSAVPANAFFIGASDGTNLRALQVDSSYNLKDTLATLIAGEDQTHNVLMNNMYPNNTGLNTYEAQITTDTTTTVTASTAYISSITWLIATASTSGTFTVQDGQGTPIKLIDLGTTGTAQTVPTVYTWPTPIKMTTGIYIVTATSAPTMNVWINYYQ